MAFDTKVYIVQKYDREGRPGDVIAAKLVFSVAHNIAKTHAPAKVLFGLADKTATLNVSDHTSGSDD